MNDSGITTVVHFKLRVNNSIRTDHKDYYFGHQVYYNRSYCRKSSRCCRLIRM